MQAIADQYQFRTFNSLRCIEEADELMRSSGLLEIAFEQLGPIFQEHQMQRLWGIGLLHNHWHVMPDEFPLQQLFETPDGAEYITLPKSLSTKGCWPSVLCYSTRDSHVLNPLEYSNDSRVERAYQKLLNSPDFIRELAARMFSFGLHKTFGLSALRHHNHDTELVEFNYNERISILREVPVGRYGDSKAIETSWSLANYDMNTACESSCFSRCIVSGGSHSHDHPKAHKPG